MPSYLQIIKRKSSNSFKFFQECVMLSLWFGTWLQVFASNTIPSKTTRVLYFYYNSCGIQKKKKKEKKKTKKLWCHFSLVPYWFDHKGSGLEESVLLIQWFKKQGRSVWKMLLCLHIGTEERRWARSGEALAWNNIGSLVQIQEPSPPPLIHPAPCCKLIFRGISDGHISLCSKTHHGSSTAQ